MVSMVRKFDQISQALDAGKISSQIAKELKVSLKDVQKVRVERGLDLGVKRREYTAWQKAIAISQKKLTALELELQRLDEQVAARKRQVADLDKEIARKTDEKARMPLYVERIRVPWNQGEVQAYLSELDYERLTCFEDTVRSVLREKQVHEIEKQLRKLE